MSEFLQVQLEGKQAAGAVTAFQLRCFPLLRGDSVKWQKLERGPLRTHCSHTPVAHSLSSVEDLPRLRQCWGVWESSHRKRDRVYWLNAANGLGATCSPSFLGVVLLADMMSCLWGTVPDLSWSRCASEQLLTVTVHSLPLRGSGCLSRALAPC